MSGEIYNILLDLGPCLSSTLVSELCRRSEIEAATARKRIERARKKLEILTVNGIRFSHNEVFLYTKDHVGSPSLHKRLFDALASSNSAYRLPLFGVRARGGLVTPSMFQTMSGFPLVARPKRPNCNEALKYLLEAGLLSQYEQFDYITVASDFAPDIASISRLRARVAAEYLVLLALRDWLRSQGLISANKATIRSEEPSPQFGFYQWDFTAPSYTLPISVKEQKDFGPGFIVADVILGRVLTVNDVQPFIHKANAVRNYKNNRPFMSFLIADWFEKDAFLLGRQNGLIFTTPKNFFGKQLAELVDDFAQVYEHKESFLEAKPNYLIRLLQNLQALSHLHQAVEAGSESIFKFLVGYCLSLQDNGMPIYKTEVGIQPQPVDIFIGSKISTTVCDVFWINDSRLLDTFDIKPWLDHLPSLFQALREDKLFPAKAYICTSTGFSSEAIEALENSAKDFDIAWLDQAAVLELIASTNPELHDVVLKTLLKTKPARFSDNF